MAFDVSAFKTTDPLGDLTIRMANDRPDFIASEVLTPHYVPKSQFKWYQYDRTNLRRVVTLKNSKSEADKVEFNVFNQTGQTLLHKLAADVDPQDERDADEPINDIEETAAMQVAEHLLIDMEQEAVDLLSTSANYASGLSTSLTTGSTTWVDPGGDPIQVIKDAKVAVRAASGQIPMDIAMAWEAVEALRIHPTLIGRIVYTGTQLPDALMLSLLGLANLHTAKAIKNTANEGASGGDSLSTIWSDNCVLYYNNPAKGRKVMTFARTFMCQDLYTYRYEDFKRGGGAGRIKVVEQGWEYNLKLIAKDSSSSAKAVAGYLIANCI